MNKKELDRFMSKLGKEGNCWVWNRYKNKDGYGIFFLDKKMQLAHRVSYTHFRGKISYTINHICRNRACVNPNHLEDITIKENTLKGNTLAAKNMGKTHCINGHKYNITNTKKYRNKRFCRKCNLIAVKRYQERRWL